MYLVQEWLVSVDDDHCIISGTAGSPQKERSLGTSPLVFGMYGSRGLRG